MNSTKFATAKRKHHAKKHHCKKKAPLQKESTTAKSKHRAERKHYAKKHHCKKKAPRIVKHAVLCLLGGLPKMEVMPMDSQTVIAIC